MSYFQPWTFSIVHFQLGTTNMNILHPPTIKTVQITPIERKPPIFVHVTCPRGASSHFSFLPAPLSFSHIQVGHCNIPLPEAVPTYILQLFRTQTILTDQHMSFLHTLSSLMRTRE